MGKDSARRRSTTGPSAIHHRRETDAGVAGELIVRILYIASLPVVVGLQGVAEVRGF